MQPVMNCTTYHSTRAANTICSIYKNYVLPKTEGNEILDIRSLRVVCVCVGFTALFTSLIQIFMPAIILAIAATAAPAANRLPVDWLFESNIWGAPWQPRMCYDTLIVEKSRSVCTVRRWMEEVVCVCTRSLRLSDTPAGVGETSWKWICMSVYFYRSYVIEAVR